MNVSVTPIFPSRDRKPEEGTSPQAQAPKPIDSKIRGFVLERISHARGGLLPSATAPQIVIDLLPAFELAKMEHAPREKRKSKLRKAPLIRRPPIGLRPVDPEGRLNALMQFILFVPDFAELFFFAPRSLYPFQEFIDQYHHDQQENMALSTANGAALFRFLSLKLPAFYIRGVIQFLLQALHPKWEVHKNVEEALQKGFLTDFFVMESSLKKQFFTEPDRYCYDLDAFIELRPDGPMENFIAYVKMEGTWYQCDDDRITQLRSNRLSIPLHRAILLHYKRIDFGRPRFPQALHKGEK